MDRQTMLFERLNLDYPGLEAAREAFHSGDFNAAADAAIAHFKSGQGRPQYIFGRAEIEKFSDRGVIARADKVMDHIMLGYALGESIDWRRNYDDVNFSDDEWRWSLSRNIYWQPLARAYALTKDEKYAREFVRQFKEFNDAWPVSEFIDAFNEYGKGGNDSNCWRTIDSSIRMYCVWLPVVEYFRDSKSLDREFWLYFLNLIYDHAQYWMKYYSFHISCSNWISMEGTALFMLGVLYPEFKPAGDWFRRGYSRVCYEVRYQFDHSGAHCERTPIYHLTAAGAFLQAYRLMLKNNITPPPYMLPILAKTGEFLMNLTKPDFTTPMLGDADWNSLLLPVSDRSLFEGMNNTMDAQDENEPRAFFRELASLTGRADFLYMATCRAQGSAPRTRELAYKDQGIYIFRDGWQEEDSFWMLAATQLERGESGVHSHRDIGHFELQIGSEDVLLDSGRYLYGRINDKRWREYFYSARAHNCVQVDAVNIGVLPAPLNNGRAVRTFCHGFGANDIYEYVDISHNGFAAAEAAVFHRRRVVRIKPGVWLIVDDFTGIGEHQYSLFFNFAPKQLSPAEEYGAYLFTGGKAHAKLLPLITQGISHTYSYGETNPFAGWISYGYAAKEPTHNVAYHMRDKTPARFATAILSGDSTARSSTKSGTLTVEVETGGKRQKVVFTPDDITVE